MHKILFLLISITLFARPLHAEECDSTTIDSTAATSSAYDFKAKQLIVSGALIAAGIFGCGNDWIDGLNRDMRDELQENIDRKISIDDFSQFAPAASVFLMDILGKKSQHNLKEKAVLMGTSALVMAAMVNSLKYTFRIRRPDGSTCNSFPSGHTATAFMGAEMLRMEYGKTAPWVCVGGYVVATATGYFRMHNNRHWLTDVVAGAGIGMLSVRVAYWLYPHIGKWFFKNPVTVAPTIDTTTKTYGLTTTLTF